MMFSFCYYLNNVVDVASKNENAAPIYNIHSLTQKAITKQFTKL
jgi:hypothetical protein